MSAEAGDIWGRIAPALAQPPVVALVVLAAVALATAVAIGLAARVRRRARKARLALIAPWTHSGASPPSVRGDSDENDADPGATPSERAFARAVAKFGLPIRLAPRLFILARPVSAVGLCVTMWFLAPTLIGAASALPLRTLIAAAAGVLGWFLPLFLSQGAAERRVTAVVSGLPDALELLVICAEGGLALADSIDRIVVELKRSQPALAEELTMTAADLKILPTQDQALARLAVRINAPIMRSVVTSLTQTMRYGTPLAQAMRVVAADLRNQALIRMEERVNSLPAYLTIPMIVFILPTIILIAGGPAALKVIDIMTR